MKLIYGKQVYDQLPIEDRTKLTEVRCLCVACDGPDPACESCDGFGVLWEDNTVDQDTIRDILNNLLVPIPKDEGTQ